MKNNLISIIIPIYNAENYLEETLISVFNQTYENYELILVNDGSTDNSEEICLKNMKERENVFYYKKINSGVSDSRNFGIKKAHGKYICFVDSDDILEKNYLLTLLNCITKNNSGLACCNYRKFNINITNISDDMEGNFKVLTKDNRFKILFSEYGGYLWNKIFIKKIIDENNIRFNKEIYMCEDMLFIIDYLKRIDCISYTEKIGYFYRIDNFSLSKNLENMNWFTIFDVIDELIKCNDIYEKNLYSNVIYFYLFKLYEGKYRLKFNKNNILYNEKKKMIESRIKNISDERKNLNNIQRTKIIFYKYFNNIAFYLKFRKEKRV